MGWLRWVGFLKIQVSLQNTGLFCRALLQKRPIFLSILLIVATPYHQHDPCRVQTLSVESLTGDIQMTLSCRSFSTKEPLNIGLFCEKWYSDDLVTSLWCRHYSVSFSCLHSSQDALMGWWYLEIQRVSLPCFHPGWIHEFVILRLPGEPLLCSHPGRIDESVTFTNSIDESS